MKRLCLILLILSGGLYAQDTNIALNLGARFNYEFKGAYRNVHSQFLVGIRPLEVISINGLVGYSKLLSYFNENLPETMSIEYVSLGFNVQYRILERYRLSPLTDFTVGTGLKSQKSSNTYLYYTGNPDYGPEYDNFVDLGKFIRVSFFASFSLMADISFEHFSIQAGGGFKFTRINKEQTFDDRRSYVNQKYFELGVAAIYKLPFKQEK